VEYRRALLEMQKQEEASEAIAAAGE
jgi:hypothetical protein